MKKLFLSCLLMLAFGSANAQPAGGFQRVDAQLTGRPVPRTFGGQLPEMNVKYDAYVAAPEGFDKERPDIAKGTLEETTYESKTVGTTRKITVYLPPKYDKSKKYPVLYLLHGIGGDHREWLQGVPGIIMDNLYADQKAVPMIIVMPNGRALPNDKPEGNIYGMQMQQGFANFERDLIDDLIPFIQSKYSTYTDAAHRAELRSGQPRSVCLRGWLLFSAQHQAARRAYSRCGGHEEQEQTTLDGLWWQRPIDVQQCASQGLLRREGRSLHAHRIS